MSTGARRMPPRADGAAVVSSGAGGRGGIRRVEKPKDFAGTARRLLLYFAPRRRQLGSVGLYAVLSTLFSILGPRLMGRVTTKLFDGFIAKYTAAFIHSPLPSIDFAYIGDRVIALIVLYVASSVFGYIQQYLMADVSQKIVFDMRRDVADRLSRLPLSYYDARTHGEIMSRVTNDIDTISTTLQQSLTQLITSLCTIAGVLVMMLTISPLLSLITVVTLPLSLAAIMRITRLSQAYFAGQQRETGAINGFVEEMYSGLSIVKAFGRERESIGRFDRINVRLADTSWKAQFVSGIVFPVMNLISNAGYVLVCVVGGIMAARKTLKLGDIQAFLLYARQFTQPISQTANIANILQSTIASAERVFEVIDEHEEPPDSPAALRLERPRGAVRFSNVRFGYSRDAPLMDGLSLDVAAGETAAIVGPTGAGKTTLVNLLMRFYEIDAGEISVDGVDICLMRRGELRGLFGMVLQDTWLFRGSIRDNIAYARPGATTEQVAAAARAAHADHFIRALPAGYDTILNEEASNVSQGEKQLITIARAILADPAILILDEATSSVDTRTESAIQGAMNTLMKGRTSFVIAHRLSTIRGARTILVMNKGAIIEMGNHAELLARGGFYAELYRSQFAGSDAGREGEKE